MKFVAAALIAIAGLVLAAGGAEAQWTVENGSEAPQHVVRRTPSASPRVSA